MPRNHSTTIRYPDPIHERLRIRAKEAGYSSVSGYLVALARYDMLTRKPHRLTAEMDRLSNEEQDRLDDKIAELFDSGESVNGVWLEAKIEEIVGEKVEDPRPIIDRLLRRITDRKG